MRDMCGMLNGMVSHAVLVQAHTLRNAFVKICARTWCMHEMSGDRSIDLTEYYLKAESPRSPRKSTPVMCGVVGRLVN